MNSGLISLKYSIFDAARHRRALALKCNILEGTALELILYVAVGFLLGGVSQ